MIPLTVRSYYSLMQGVNSPEEICTAAANLGYDRVALTDTDNLYGLWPFLKACRRTGIIPIIGSELTDAALGISAVCLVENATGYRNLCRLITRRHTNASFDLKSFLISHSQGLFMLVRSSELLQALAGAGVNVAAALSGKPDSAGWRLRRLARRLGIACVATPDSFFIHPGDFTVHKMLRAIDLNTSLSRVGVKDTALPDAWFAGPEEYARRFSVWPDAVSASVAIGKSLTFTGPEHGLVMPVWKDKKGYGAKKALRNSVYRGAFRRYGKDLPEPVVERLEYELNIIEKKNFSSYFLVVQDIVRRSPRICGRGSGAASIVAFCLGITNICPIKFNLYFERFLNPERSDPPDIDVDFAWDERDDVIDSVLRRFEGHAAMVCTHVFFQPRMAIREVAKVFGLAEREISRVTKRLPWSWRARQVSNDMTEGLKALPEIGVFDFCEPWPDIIKMAGRIVGLPRYLSVHSGGIVITPDSIDHYVPVENARKGVPVVQWDKDSAEDGGLVKIDLLGNRSLAVIRDAIKNIRANGISFDEEHWAPEEDTATQKAVAEGRTMGCFYIESPAMRLLQEKAGTGDFEHLVIHSSIIRPAANDSIREYLKRLHGAKWQPIHPLMSDLLDETYGIMVYQEDVSKTAVALAGFSHQDADGLRKILSKKDRLLRLQDYRRRFTEGARSRGVSREQVQEVWAAILSFSGYSFCKPHSASYARVSFQSAYLKTHFPAEFMAAVISNRGGYYTTFAYVSEARRMGIRMLPPDVNASAIQWKGRDKFVRAGLMSLAGLSLNTMQKIVSSGQDRPFRSVGDFIQRINPDEDEARSLVHSGAFDALYPCRGRTSILWAIFQARKTRCSQRGQQDLFEKKMDMDIPVLPLASDIQRLRREFSVLGFLCDRHPLALYGDILKKKRTVKAAHLYRFSGQRVRLAGFLITGKVVRTKHGEPMEFVTFEDDTGLFETTFFPDTYRRFCSMLHRKGLFLLDGRVEEDFGAFTLVVSGLEFYRFIFPGRINS